MHFRGFCFVRTQSQADRHQYRRQAIFLLVSQSSFQRQPHLALTHRLTVSTKLIHHTMCSLLVPSTLHATAFVVCGSGTTVCGTPSTGKLGSEFSMQALSSDDVRCISPHQPGKAAKVGLFVSARVLVVDIFGAGNRDAGAPITVYSGHLVTFSCFGV